MNEGMGEWAGDFSLLSYFFTERPLRWGTSSVSYFFSEQPLIWATSAPSCLPTFGAAAIPLARSVAASPMPCCAQPCQCHSRLQTPRANPGLFETWWLLGIFIWNPTLESGAHFAHMICQKWHGLAAKQFLTKPISRCNPTFFLSTSSPAPAETEIVLRRPQEPLYPTDCMVSRPRLFSRVNSRVPEVVHHQSSALTSIVLHYYHLLSSWSLVLREKRIIVGITCSSLIIVNTY